MVLTNVSHSPSRVVLASQRLMDAHLLTNGLTQTEGTMQVAEKIRATDIVLFAS